MSYCPRPSKKVTKDYAVRGTKKVTGGTPRFEACEPSTNTVVTSPGTPNESTSTTIEVPGPAGPAGKVGLGFKWKGPWVTGTQYQAQDPLSDDEALRHSDVVSHNGQTYICTLDHIADSMSEPRLDTFVGPSDWGTNWALLVKSAAGGLAPADKDFFDILKDDIFDWVKNASLGELLLAGAAVVGVLWAGSKIIESMTDNGEGDGDADTRYTGSPGYVTTAFTAPDIKVVLAELCNYGSIPYDVSSLPDEACQLTIGQNTSIRSILSTLSLAYQFEMVDTAGSLKFVSRAGTAVKTIPMSSIGYSKGSVGSVPFTTKRFQGIDLPRSVTLSYMAEDTDYNSFTQVSQLPTYEEGQDVTISVPVTLTHEKAKQIAELALIQSHVERTQYKFTLTYNDLDLEPGDVIDTPMGMLRITKINEIDEGLIEVEGTDAGALESIQGSNLVIAIPPASINIPITLGYSQAFWIDPGIMGDSDTGTRIYAAVHGFDRAGWPGAQLFMSENSGSTYEGIGLATKEATIGLVTAVTPAADYYVWDNSTSISVTLKTNELISVSELDVLNGKNFCMVGQEVIGFKTATLTGPKTYTLSGLLRGRRGTEQFVSTHVANELFVMLDESLVRIDLESGDRNVIKKFKAVTIGSALDKVLGEDVQITSNNLRLWTIRAPKVLKVGSDYNFTWGERVRYNNLLTDSAELTHDVDWAGYGIGIYSADGGTLVKTYTTQSEAWSYTAAMQTADFGAVQPSVKAKVVQMSQLGAPGYPTTINS